LPTLQQATGLTRMHFAARLNAVTGLQPSRTPLLCRRIERAQEMLVGTVLSLVNAALSVQFQTQAALPQPCSNGARANRRTEWRESVALQTGPTSA